MENANQEQEAAVVISQQSEPVAEPRQEPAARTDNKQSLRKSLEKNFKESEDTSGRPTNGTQTEPAPNKSFVNGSSQQQAAPAETILPPASMNAEEKKAWETLPLEAKKFLSRREYQTRSELSRQTEGLSHKEREVSDVLGVITPELRAEYTRDGIAIPDLVRRSIAWDKRVKEGPDGALEFLQAHGYQLEDLYQYQPQQEQPVYLTAEEAERIANETFQKNLELHQQSGIAEQNANALKSYLDSHQVFRGDPGTAAQFENAVAEEIEYLKFRGFSGSTSDLLNLAHDRAISNNEAFSSLKPQAAPTAKPENIYEQMERVRQAKAASKSASGSLGSGSPAYKSNSLRESLERNYAKS
jgi:hypothetical protein